MSGVGAGWPPPFGCGAGAAGAFAAAAATSSPSPARIAMGVFTATLSVSSGTRIFARMPSSIASTSIVALSVSISARTSPGFTGSPSFLSHFASLPCSIVGERAGIRMSVAMGCSSFLVVPAGAKRRAGILEDSALTTKVPALVCGSAGMRWSALGASLQKNVGPQLRHVRLRVVGRELGRLVDDLADLAVDLLELVVGDLPQLDEAAADLLDRVVLLAHAGDLVLGAVLRRIGHGVAAVAVGLHLEDERALARPAMLDGAAAGVADGAHVHAVDLLAGDVERHAALREIGLGRGAGDRGAHGVAVVLDHVDHRELPQLGHVEALVDLALVRGAVAEIGERDAPVLPVPVGEAEPGAERDLSADGAVAAVEVLLLGEHVHRAALALGVAAAASGELGHHPLRIHPANQHVPVIPVSRDHLIPVLRGHLHADDDGLLADVEMAETADQAHAVHLAGLLLEAADEQHLAIGVELLVLRELRAGLAGLILRCAFRGAAGTAGSKGHRCLRTVLLSLLTQR